VKSPGCCPCPTDTKLMRKRHDPFLVAPGKIGGAGRRGVLAGRNRAGSQTGVALVTVLLIVFLAAIAATSLATMQQLAIRRGAVLQHQQQARLYTLGAEQWAGLILMRDRHENTIDHLGEEWANLPLALPVEGGVLSGQIRDLQSCFNLNNLWQPAPGEQPEPSPDNQQDSPAPQDDDQDQDQDQAGDGETAQSTPPAAKPQAGSRNPQPGKGSLNKSQIKILQRLLTYLELKPELAQAIADWIDPDPDILFPDGAEDSDYTVLNPPYLAANRPFASVSELRLVKGVDREAYDKLAPVVCALPPGTPLNVNTAPAQVLAALAEGVEPAELERPNDGQPAQNHENVDDFLNAAKLTVDAPTKALLGVSSEYFSLRAEARVGDGRAMLYSTLYRDENSVRVLRRSFGNQD
jgi:general secretion pathway protein K